MKYFTFYDTVEDIYNFHLIIKDQQNNFKQMQSNIIASQIIIQIIEEIMHHKIRIINKINWEVYNNDQLLSAFKPSISSSDPE